MIVAVDPIGELISLPSSRHLVDWDEVDGLTLHQHLGVHEWLHIKSTESKLQQRQVPTDTVASSPHGGSLGTRLLTLHQHFGVHE